MEALTRLITYLVPLIILITIGFIYFGGEKSLFVELKAAVSKLPTVKLGVETQKAGELVVPKETQKAAEELVRIINLSRGNNCLVGYNGPKPEKESRLVFEKGAVHWNLVARDKVGRELKKYSLEKNIIPCIVAGDPATENFFYRFIDPKEGSGVEPYYLEISSSSLEINEKGVSWGGKDYEFQNYLFKPDSNHLCLIPTVTQIAITTCTPGTVFTEALTTGCFDKGVISTWTVKIPSCSQ